MDDQTADIRQRLFESRARRIHGHREKFMKARSKYEAELTKLFPLGAYVCWMHNSKSEQSGYVVLHGSYARIRVRNSTTKTELWIEPYQILQYLTRSKA
jgi:hypothetical protein